MRARPSFLASDIQGPAAPAQPPWSGIRAQHSVRAMQCGSLPSRYTLNTSRLVLQPVDGHAARRREQATRTPGRLAAGQVTLCSTAQIPGTPPLLAYAVIAVAPLRPGPRALRGDGISPHRIVPAHETAAPCSVRQAQNSPARALPGGCPSGPFSPTNFVRPPARGAPTRGIDRLKPALHFPLARRAPGPVSSPCDRTAQRAPPASLLARCQGSQAMGDRP